MELNVCMSENYGIFGEALQPFDTAQIFETQELVLKRKSRSI